MARHVRDSARTYSRGRVSRRHFLASAGAGGLAALSGPRVSPESVAPRTPPRTDQFGPAFEPDERAVVEYACDRGGAPMAASISKPWTPAADTSRPRGTCWSSWTRSGCQADPAPRCLPPRGRSTASSWGPTLSRSSHPRRRTWSCEPIARRRTPGLSRRIATLLPEFDSSVGLSSA